MPVGNFTSLGTTTAIDTSADVTLTLSGEIPTGALAFCAVHIGQNNGVNAAAPTSVTGGGVTWELETTNAYDTTGTARGSLFVYRAYASAPSGTSVVVDLAATAAQVLVGVGYVTGAISSGNGASAILQELTAATFTVAASTLTDTTNNAFVAFGAWNSTSTRTGTADTDPAMTEVWDFTATNVDVRRAALYSEYVVGTAAVNPTINYTISGAVDASAIVVYEVAALVGPTITVQPVADTVILTNETTTSFSVTATGTGTLLYDWELETSVGSGTYANVANGDGLTFTGGTSATLNVSLTAKTASGRRLRCNVTDDNGTTTTDAVALTIFDGPQLTTFPATNGSGVSTATLTCDYVTGVGEAIEVAIVLPDGRLSVSTTTT